MSAAVAAANPAMTQWNGIKDAVLRQQDIWAVRYVWYGGPEPLNHKDIESQTIAPLSWVPVIPREHWRNILSFGAGNAPVKVRPVSMPGRPAEKPREGMTYIKPAVIVASLQETFGERGLLVSQLNCSFEEFQALQLDSFFFPNKKPATYQATKDYLEAFRDKLGKMGETGARFLSLCDEMLNSLRITHSFHLQQIDATHAEMERARTDTTGRYKGTYDRSDLMRLEWLGMTRRDEALNKLAAENNELPKLVGQLVQVQLHQIEANKQQQPVDIAAIAAAAASAAVKELLAVQKPEETMKPEPVKASIKQPDGARDSKK